MKVSIVGNLRAFSQSRPPFVVFTVSLLAMTVTLFVVAIYIRDKDLLLDLHTQEDWNSFVKILSSRKLCTKLSKPSKSPNPARSLALAAQNGTIFSAKVSNMNVNSLQSPSSGNAISFVGQMPSKGMAEWRHSCQHDRELFSDESDGLLTITLIIPSLEPFESQKELKACVIITGSPQYLPPANPLQIQHCGALNVTVQEIGEIAVYDLLDEVPKNRSTDVCGPSDAVHISYDAGNFSPSIYLTTDEKLRIFSHLLQVGYVLLVLIILMLLIAVVQGRSVLLSKRHTLLVDKEAFSS